MSPSSVPFGDAVRVWARVGLQSFGGPAGQIAVMHRILVEEKGWIGESRFLHALNFCMLLPGPEAQQLATCLGWMLHGVRGGLVAGIFFVLPGVAALLALSMLYATYQSVGLVAGLFFGLKAAVLGVIVQALWRLGRKVLRSPPRWAVASAAFVALFLYQVPFPWIVVGAGLVGLLGSWWMPGLLRDPPPPATEKEDDGARPLDVPAPAHTRPRWGSSLRTLGTCLLLWGGPVLLLWTWLGPGDVFVQEALFFSKAAVLTFGGAYAVLAYIAQQAVERYGWLVGEEMLDGLGMAETTPGPLIMVVQFVGFMGAYRNPGTLDPLLAGTLGALLTTWVTFVPCFLWIFLGAPFLEWLRGNARLSAALSAVTAAVVGVILNLAVWFGVQVLFGEVEELCGPLGTTLPLPIPSSLDPAAALLGTAAILALLRFGARLWVVLAGCAVVGMLWRGLVGG